MNFFLIQLPVWHPFLEKRLPDLALAVPMEDGGDGSDVPLADRVAVLHGPGEEQDLILDVGRQVEKVHGLRDAGPGHPCVSGLCVWA